MTVSESVVGRVIDDIVEREGGFVDNPADKGGPTKYGITLAVLADWRRSWQKKVTREDVRDMPVGEARDIYRRRYVEQPGFIMIEDPALFAFVVDAAANHGVKMATMLLQRALGVRDDGLMGPVTIRALEAADPETIYFGALAERAELYGRIITKNITDADRDGVPDATEFASGWLNRLAGFIRRGHVDPGAAS